MSKADEIRRLLAEGHSRSDVARLAGVAYQQVYQVDKKRTGGGGGSYSQRPSARQRLPGWRPWPGDLSDVVTRPRAFGERPLIRKGPKQDRIAAQDGHLVLLSDDITGLACLNCLEPIVFSALERAYVHTFSRAPVIRTVSTQSGSGLFER